jgi:hypothetical protein
MSAKQLYGHMRAVLLSESFRVTGTGTAGGVSVNLDVAYGHSGAAGTAQTGGLEFSVRKIDDAVYVKAPAALWTSVGQNLNSAHGFSTEQIARLTRSWVKIQNNGVLYEQVEGVVDRAPWCPSCRRPTKSAKLTKSAGRPINGVRTIELSDGSGNELFVSAVDGTLVEQDGKSGKSSFSDYGTVFEPTAPDPSQTVDGASLGI